MFSKVARHFYDALKNRDSESKHSVIAHDVVVDGFLRFDGIVHLEGRFTGTIHSTGTLYVGKGAIIDAQVSVSHLIVMGKFTGTARASGSVELRKTASFTGVIEAPKMNINPDAVFEGDFRSTANLLNDLSSSQDRP